MTCSIVITAYNISQYVEDAIRTSVNQKVGEVIVVDDKSTDGTLSVLKELQSRSEYDFTIVANEKNLGAGMSRRIGIEHATGDYVLLLDGDDWLEEGFIRELLDKAENSDIVCGGIKIHRETGGYEATSYGNSVKSGIQWLTDNFGKRMMFLNNKIVRRSLYDKVPYSERRYVEDTPTVARLVYYANEIRSVDNVGYNYRMRGGSLTHEGSAAQNAMFRGLCMKDMINWFSDKPREWRDLFKRGRFLIYGKQFMECPKGQLEAVQKKFPNEYNEFMVTLQVYTELYKSLEGV